LDLDRYEQEATRHCLELVEELREFGVQRLQSLCKEIGTEKFRVYVQENDTALIDFVRASPSQRKKMHRTLSPENRALFVLAALYHARWAQSLLDVVCRYGVTAGPSYRMITAQAATACCQLRENFPSLWAFEEEDDVPDPFDGE
jgi:hypothetical protein